MLLTNVAFSVISIMLYYMQKYKQTERILQGLVARDFDSNEGLEVKEYFVYFEFYELKSWVKRSANNCRRINQRLLQGRLFCGIAAQDILRRVFLRKG